MTRWESRTFYVYVMGEAKISVFYTSVVDQ